MPPSTSTVDEAVQAYQVCYRNISILSGRYIGSLFGWQLGSDFQGTDRACFHRIRLAKRPLSTLLFSVIAL